MVYCSLHLTHWLIYSLALYSRSKHDPDMLSCTSAYYLFACCSLSTLSSLLLAHHQCMAVAGETALTLAAGSGEQLTVQLLLEHGANISRCRTAGAQAIHTAAASGISIIAVLCCAVDQKCMACHGSAVLCMTGQQAGTQQAALFEHFGVPYAMMCTALVYGSMCPAEHAIQFWLKDVHMLSSTCSGDWYLACMCTHMTTHYRQQYLLQACVIRPGLRQHRTQLLKDKACPCPQAKPSPCPTHHQLQIIIAVPAMVRTLQHTLQHQLQHTLQHTRQHRCQQFRIKCCRQCWGCETTS